MQHAALAVRHFRTAAHTGENIASAVDAILTEYNLAEDNTPVTTNHGSNVIAVFYSKV